MKNPVPPKEAKHGSYLNLLFFPKTVGLRKEFGLSMIFSACKCVY